MPCCQDNRPANMWIFAGSSAPTPVRDRYAPAELGRPRQTGPTVTIPFRKAGGEVSGINLYRQRKGEKSPQKVGFFMRTPAIDTTPGKSGQLTYTARAVIDREEVGLPSEAVSVKVT